MGAEETAYSRAYNIPTGSDLAVGFAGILSKALYLSDCMEEESYPKRMYDTLKTVQRLADRRQ